MHAAGWLRTAAAAAAAAAEAAAADLNAVSDGVGGVESAPRRLRCVHCHRQPQPAPALGRRHAIAPVAAAAAVDRAANGGGVGGADGADEGAVAA